MVQKPDKIYSQFFLRIIEERPTYHDAIIKHLKILGPSKSANICVAYAEEFHINDR
jgi:hypothetical protein